MKNTFCQCMRAISPTNLPCVFYSKRDKLIGYALKTLEDNFPQQSKGLKKLKDFYNWATDRDSEYDLLQRIIKSAK